MAGSEFAPFQTPTPGAGRGGGDAATEQAAYDVARLAVLACGAASASVTLRDGDRTTMVADPQAAPQAGPPTEPGVLEEATVWAASALPADAEGRTVRLEIRGVGQPPATAQEAADRLMARLADAVGQAACRVDHAELEQAAQLALAAMERRQESTTLFAAQVGQVVRAPLASLVATTELLEEHPALTGDPDLAALVGSAMRSGRRLQTIVGALVAHSRGAEQVRFGELDVAALVEVVVRDLEPLLTDAGARVLCRAQGLVVGDPGLLSLAVEHLLRRALRHARPGTAPVVEVDLTPHAEGWRLAVSDNGRHADDAGGGDPESPRSVEEPSADRMGLATVRSLIAAHGGTVGVEPSELGGTTVWLDLPTRELTVPSPQGHDVAPVVAIGSRAGG